MKKILFFASILFGLSAIGQVPKDSLHIKQTLGSTSTIVISKAGLKADSVFLLPVFIDTLRANKGPNPKYYPGDLIRTGDSVWMRSTDTTRWLLVYTSAKFGVDTIYRTAGKDSIQFTIGGRYHAIKDSTGGGSSGWSLSLNSITAGTDKIGTLNNARMNFYTNNVNTMTLDSLGARLFLKGGLNPLLSLKQNTSSKDYQLRVGVGTGISNTGFNIYDAAASKIRMYMSGENVAFGDVTAIPSPSRLYLYGGSSGANFDSRPDSSVYDETNIEAEHSQYDSGPDYYGYGLAMQVNGNVGAFGSTFGHPNKNMSQLRFTNNTNLIRVINNASLRFGTNNTERMVLDSNGRLGINIAVPNASALLDISSTSKGALVPRMNGTQQNAISSPATGLLIYNTDSVAFCYYNGSIWVKIGNASAVGGGTVTQVNTGYGLTGGPITTTGTAVLDSATVFPQLISTIALTTTGSSGPATWSTASRTLNIPQYQGAITPAALTKTDDTNVTLTLGGSPSTALLQATSLTLGWTGDLAFSRIAQLPTVTLAGNSTGGTADIQAITLAPGLSFVGTVLTPADASATNEIQTVTGTANRITVTGGGGSTPTVDIAATYVGQTSITTLGTIATGTWQATSIKTDYGGTGLTSWTQGDIPYYASGTALSKLAKSTSPSQFLSNNGASNNPAWMTITAAMIGSGEAITKTDDTNVTLTLGGSPSTAVLAATSFTLGWTGDLAFSRIAQLPTVTLAGNSTGGTADIQPITLAPGLAFVGTVLTPADASATNEIQHITAGGSTSPTIDLDGGGGTVTFNGAGSVSLSRSSNTITITSGPTTANNGLTMSTATNAQTGGTLLHNTTIDGGSNYAFTFAGNFATSTESGVLKVTQSHINGNGIYSDAAQTGSTAFSGVFTTGFGISVSGTDGTAVVGTVVDGLAANFTANGAGNAIQGYSETGIVTILTQNNTSTNAVNEILRISAQTSGTAANGLGASLDFDLESTTTSARLANQLISQWTDATDASRTSEFIITGVDNATTADLFTLSGSGALKLNKYGSGTFTGTPAYSLSVDASGNIIESTVSALTLASGRYTPSVSAIVNCSVSVTDATYMRVGNAVTVSGWIQVDFTNCNSAASARMDLPVGTAMTADVMLAGTCTEAVYGAANGVCSGYPASDEVLMTFRIAACSVGAVTVYYRYIYTYYIE